MDFLSELTNYINNEPIRTFTTESKITTAYTALYERAKQYDESTQMLAPKPGQTQEESDIEMGDILTGNKRKRRMF